MRAGGFSLQARRPLSNLGLCSFDLRLECGLGRMFGLLFDGDCPMSMPALSRSMGESCLLKLLVLG